MSTDPFDLLKHMKEKEGEGGAPPPPPPPDQVSPKRVLRRRKQEPIEPWVDPELQELIDLPIPEPILRKEIKRQQAANPIEKEIDLMQRYREKPLLFWRDELGVPIDVWRDDKPPIGWKPGDPVPLWSKQREIIEALVKYRKVVVTTGHGVGKTYIAAGLALYLSLVWHATGLTTAPTFRQVRRALWGEIHYQYNRARNPLGGKLNQVSLDLGDKWFVEGFATDKPTDNITGIHEENIFVIVDEAGGILPETYDALDAILTSETSFVLYIGNPTNPVGPFRDAAKPGSGFKHIHISCYDCPNVKHDRIIYSKLTSKAWVVDKEKKWGKHSTLFKIRVEGEFVDESRDTLIPVRYIDAALAKAKNGDIVPTTVSSFGLDVARQGSDSSVYGVKYNSGFFRILETTNKKRETDTAGRMKYWYNELVPQFKFKQLDNAIDRANRSIDLKLEDEEDEGISENGFPPINVDDIGVGGGVVDILLEDDYPVNGINVAKPPDKTDQEASNLFLNKRAQYYWKLRKVFEDGLIAIEDEELAGELNKIRIEFLRSGKIKIVDKEILKKELGKSPDRAESLMLAYSEDFSETNSDLVRFI